MNELIFLLYVLLVVISSIAALALGKEALVSLICIKVILMNLLVPQEIMLFGFSATPVDALAVGTSLSLNLLNEYFGKAEALRAVTISSLGALFYVLVTLLHRAYMPAPTDVYACHFEPLLSLAPRIIAASFCAYFITQKLEAKLYAVLKTSRLQNHFMVRNYLSIGITQFIDTVLFSYLGLYGVIDSIGQVIAVAYTIKIVTIICAVPLLTCARQLLLLVIGASGNWSNRV